MLLSVLNEGLARFPIYIEVATVEAHSSMVSRERLTKVTRTDEGYFIVEIDRKGENRQNITFIQIEEPGLLVWVKYLTPNEILRKTCHMLQGPPYYQIHGLITEHIHELGNVTETVCEW